MKQSSNQFMQTCKSRMRVILGFFKRFSSPARIWLLARRACSVLFHEGPRGFIAHYRGFSSDLQRLYERPHAIDFRSCKYVGIVTTRHTHYIALLIQHQLASVAIQSKIFIDQAQPYEDIPYILICPQFLRQFPKEYVVLQMEQTVSSRWLTDAYIQILAHAQAIFDYSLVNIAYFRKNPLLAGKLYYLPIDYLPALDRDLPQEDLCYDVLFYGDTNNPRRQALLQQLKQEFRIHVVNDVFGEALYRQIRRARVVLNLHYYEGALLETTRLYETLSLNRCVIVSEKSADPQEEARLADIVDFVDLADVAQIKTRLRYWLDNESARLEKVAANQRLLQSRSNAFSFYFQRFLLAQNAISFDAFYRKCGAFIHFDTNRICLSLAETTERRAAFDRDNRYGFSVFPGLRHVTGWIGCGLSYKFIMQKAQEQGISHLIVCEDDTYFPPDFEARFQHVLHYLKQRDDWDLFSGLIADANGVRVTGVTVADGEMFIRVNRMMSMVFNIYADSIYPHFAAWDPCNDDIDTNTIDCFLSDRNLRVITTSPYLVGHKEDMASSLWEIDNSAYSDRITQSNQKLAAMAQAYLKK